MTLSICPNSYSFPLSDPLSYYIPSHSFCSVLLASWSLDTPPLPPNSTSEPLTCCFFSLECAFPGFWHDLLYNFLKFDLSSNVTFHARPFLTTLLKIATHSHSSPCPTSLHHFCPQHLSPFNRTYVAHTYFIACLFPLWYVTSMKAKIYLFWPLPGTKRCL